MSEFLILPQGFRPQSAIALSFYGFFSGIKRLEANEMMNRSVTATHRQIVGSVDGFFNVASSQTNRLRQIVGARPERSNGRRK